ncbi:hypothetical protein E3P99_02020 [Wallemia hederae]|uniref:JmjC domain-containing protein n=1 Tax=Wallemia hederae TaxID=1540922 RepID=A0A4V4LTA4_9BASI|nr:hypothetical protein E3P99_02020 [Wallemia hederae]
MKLRQIKTVSAEEFYSCIPGVACVVTGVFTQPWIHASHALNRKGLGVLMEDEDTASQTVPIEIQQPNTPLTQESRHEIPMNLFIRLFIQNQDKVLPQRGYLAQFNLIESTAYLRNLFPPIPQIQRLHPKSSSWLGPKHTLTPIHRDAATEGNILLQVAGTKRVNVIHPKYSNHLNLHPSNSPLRNFSKFLEEVPSQQVPIQIDSATLNPGDAVYIPPGHFHSFKSLSNSFSVNFWFVNNT